MVINGKVIRINSLPNPFIKGNILSKLSLDELDYLFAREIFSQSDIICELLKRCKNKK